MGRHSGEVQRAGLKTPQKYFIVPNRYFFRRYNQFLYRNAKISLLDLDCKHPTTWGISLMEKRLQSGEPVIKKKLHHGEVKES